MATFEERISQLQLVRAFRGEVRELGVVDSESRGSFRSTLMMVVLVMTMLLLLAPILGLLATIGVYHLMSEVIAKRMTLGDVALVAAYGLMLARPVIALGWLWTSLQAPIAGMRRIHNVLDNLPSEPASSRNGQLAERIREIEFSDVTIGYSLEPPVLEHVSVRFFAGELVGIAGPSGAGKTTLINCMPRFIEPLAGEILINGVDVRATSLAALRKRIALVFQEEALFSVTIAENISYAVPGASTAAIRKAAEMAGAAEFIELMPRGYSTVLGRRGTRLSAGQKQRVAIARALMREPDVLILDEPMGPLDPASERSLLMMLRELASTRIVIVVAHRAETLTFCDRVYLVSEGRLRAAAVARGN